MARPLRIEYAGAFYHVISRGNERKAVFKGENDYELLLELLDIFQDDYKEKRKAIDNAVQKKNADELRNIAHSLKGASSNISAKKIHTYLSQLERLAEDQDWKEVQSIVDHIDTSYIELSSFIRQFKKKMKGL